MNEKLKWEIDKIQIPETALNPSSILKKAMTEKISKQKRQAKVFFALQVMVLLFLLFLISFNLKLFLWIQIPVILVGISSIIWVKWKGVKTHEH